MLWVGSFMSIEHINIRMNNVSREKKNMIQYGWRRLSACLVPPHVSADNENCIDKWEIHFSTSFSPQRSQ